jgi:thiosulfate/3-mercaptopyruvate sulfurtransferase
MFEMKQSPLIAADALAERLGRDDWIVVDCRFTLTDPPSGRKAYERGHIPGARYAHLDDDLARAPGPADGRHPLPEPTVFAATLGRWGVTSAATVVAYDDASGAIAARLWWLLGWIGHERRAVLDGGFAAWQQAGLPIETQTPAVAPRHYELVRLPSSASVVTANDLPARQAAGGLLVDARGAPRYRGEQEPIDTVAGHVPGALNRPFSTNVTAGGRFRPAHELHDELTNLLAGRDPKQLIAMCGSGVTACHLLLALEHGGLGSATLYAGSWSEWIRDPRRPIKTGEEP